MGYVLEFISFSAQSDDSTKAFKLVDYISLQESDIFQMNMVNKATPCCLRTFRC